MGVSSERHWIFLNGVMIRFFFVNMTALSFVINSRTDSRVFLISGTPTDFVSIYPSEESLPSRAERMMRAGWLVAVNMKSLFLSFMPGAGVGQCVGYAAESKMILDLPLSLGWSS